MILFRTGYLILSLIFIYPGFLYAKSGHKHKQDHYKKPVVVQSIQFNVKYTDDAVSTSWKRYKRMDFLYYKVIKSKSNPNPVYPEDRAIFYTEDAHETSFKDKELEEGKWYYRLCIITQQKQRWVSPVVTVEIRKDQSGNSIPSDKDFE